MLNVKFRGKRKRGDEWIIGDLNHIQGGVFIFPRVSAPLNSTDWFEVEPSSIGMFTQLTDKHGKEIFVGDIISRKDVYSAYIHTVTFDKGKFIASNRIRPESHKWLSDNSASYDLYFLFSSIKDFEIIGNATDNPELLNQ